MFDGIAAEAMMPGRQTGFWDVEDRLRDLSEHGDPLERLAATADFEIFRADLVAALAPRDPPKGGHPGFDPVLKFRMLVVQSRRLVERVEPKAFRLD